MHASYVIMLHDSWYTMLHHVTPCYFCTSSDKRDCKPRQFTTWDSLLCQWRSWIPSPSRVWPSPDRPPSHRDAGPHRTWTQNMCSQCNVIPIGALTHVELILNLTGKAKTCVSWKSFKRGRNHRVTGEALYSCLAYIGYSWRGGGSKDPFKGPLTP